MPRMFADLHVHPTFYPFNNLRNTPQWEGDPDIFQPWHPVAGNHRAQKKGGNAATYPQASMPQLLRGKVRIAFCSITPVEKGFFGHASEDFERPFWSEALRTVTGINSARAAWFLARRGKLAGLGELLRVVRNTGPARVALQKAYLGYPLRRIRFLMSDTYDYWDEFLREIAFTEARDGRASEGRLRHYDGDRARDETVTGTYHLVRSAAHLREIIEGSDDDVALVMNIEGGHTFSIGPSQQPVSEATMMERIAQLKALPHAMFFVTLAHHFDNGLCGHARSIPDLGELVIDQSRRLREPFEGTGLGMRVARELLDLDEDLEPRGGRRILIDIKHMSARARRQFYDEIILPFNAAHPDTKIPIVAGHIAYSGVSTLAELITNEPREGDDHLRGPFNAWSINLSDEDVRNIHDSEGLLGVILDRRVLGVRPGDTRTDDEWRAMVGRQILAMVDAVMGDDSRTADDRRAIWDRICIGSDCDGAITPVPRYATVTNWDHLVDDLQSVLHANRHTRMIDDIGVDELLEKICWKNAYQFALNHLPQEAP